MSTNFTAKLFTKKDLQNSVVLKYISLQLLNKSMLELNRNCKALCQSVRLLKSNELDKRRQWSCVRFSRQFRILQDSIRQQCRTSLFTLSIEHLLNNISNIVLFEPIFCSWLFS